MATGLRTRRAGLRRNLLAAASLAALASPPLLATPAAAAESSAIEEVVVTAQRRNERLEDVPMSMTAISSETLDSSGVVRFEDLGQLSAGVRISRAGSFMQPTIRGVTTSSPGVGMENNVAVYVDGFYQPDALQIGMDLVDLSGIEVLKGPQGSLYGRNATGGAILIKTRDPDDEFGGRVEASYGRFNDQRYAAMVSIPLGEGISFGISGYHSRNDGYIRDVNLGDAAPFRNQVIRAKLKLEPTDNLKVVFGYTYYYKFDPRGTAYTVYAQSFNPGTGRAVPLGPLHTEERDRSSLTYLPSAWTRGNELTATAEWRSGIGLLTYRLSYGKQRSRFDFDNDGSGVAISSVGAEPLDSRTMHSVQYAIDAIPRLDLLIGAELYREDWHNFNNFFQSFATVTRGEADGGARAWAVYADATYAVTDKLFITLGGRYSDEEKIFSAVFGAAVNIPQQSVSYTAFTPRAVIRYEIAPDTNVYASYSQGFKSGLFNTVGTSPVPVRPEKIKAYEVGFKTVRSGLRFDTAAYYYDYTDLQVSAQTDIPGLGLRTILTNAAAAKIYGAEAQVSASPIEDLNLRAGVAYNHARYDSFPRASAVGYVPATDSNNTAAIQNWTDLHFQRVPDWTANVGGDYTIPAFTGSLRFSANVSYSSWYTPTTNSLMPDGVTLRYRQSPYAIANAQVSWTDSSERVELTLYGDNIFNTRYAIVKTGSATGSIRVLGPPAGYGVKAAYKF